MSLLAGLAAMFATGSAMAENISVWSSTSVEQHNGEQPIVRQEFYTNQPAADVGVSTFLAQPEEQRQMMQQDTAQYQAQSSIGENASPDYQQTAPVYRTYDAPQQSVTAAADQWDSAIWQSSVTGMFDMQAFFNDLFGRLGMTPPVISQPEQQATHLMIYLNGFQQVPSVNTPGYGVSHLMLDGHQLRYSVDVRGLTSPVSGAHFHRAQAGANGPVVFAIPFQGAHAEGVWNLSDQDLQDVMSGRIYLNVHTQQYPDGEVRGQL